MISLCHSCILDPPSAPKKEDSFLSPWWTVNYLCPVTAADSSLKNVLWEIELMCSSREEGRSFAKPTVLLWVGQKDSGWEPFWPGGSTVLSREVPLGAVFRCH